MASSISSWSQWKNSSWFQWQWDGVHKAVATRGSSSLFSDTFYSWNFFPMKNLDSCRGNRKPGGAGYPPPCELHHEWHTQTTVLVFWLSVVVIVIMLQITCLTLVISLYQKLEGKILIFKSLTLKLIFASRPPKPLTTIRLPVCNDCCLLHLSQQSHCYLCSSHLRVVSSLVSNPILKL